MKKVLANLLFVSFLFAGCGSLPNSSETPVADVTINHSDADSKPSSSFVYISSTVAISDSIPGLSYLLPIGWNEIDRGPDRHVYTMTGNFDTGLNITYVTEKNGKPIDSGTIFDEMISDIQTVDSLMTMEVNADYFLRYPCIYITAAYSFEPSNSDPQIIDRLNQYVLAFVANNALYTVTLTTPDDIALYQKDFDEVVGSFEISDM
jgi:hypothetical protein